MGWATTKEICVVLSRSLAALPLLAVRGEIGVGRGVDVRSHVEHAASIERNARGQAVALCEGRGRWNGREPARMP